MRKTYKVDTITVPKTETKTFKQKAAHNALLAYLILTLLGVYTGFVFYEGTQYQGAKSSASADAIHIVKLPAAAPSTPAPK